MGSSGGSLVSVDDATQDRLLVKVMRLNYTKTPISKGL